MHVDLGKVHNLCRYCSALFPLRAAPRHTQLEHYPTILELITAVKATGCPLCAFFQENLPLQTVQQQFPGTSLTELYDAEVEIFINNEGPYESSDESSDEAAKESDPGEVGEMSTLQSQVEYLSLDLAYSTDSTRFEPIDEVKLAIATCNSAESDPPAIWTTSQATTSHTEKLKVINKWLQLCEDSHHLCKQALPQSATALPKRLIELAPVGSARQSRIALCENIVTKNKISGVKYAALSHCWGSTVPLRTTKKNLDNLQQAIPGCDGQWTSSPDHISWTFRQAIDICRAIGVNYLWIDSLCIVQDDEIDWRTEAARMKDVYWNAWITIAASSASNGTDGCFVDKHKNFIVDPFNQVTRFRTQKFIPTKATDDGEQAAPGLLGELNSHCFMVRAYADAISSRSKTSTLSQRGWVLQEQVLSRRILHCTFPELHWQCTSCYETEAGVTLNEPRPEFSHLRTIREIELDTSGLYFGDTRRRAWDQWMTNYSHRKFTFASDWLAALSGLVQQYANMTGFTHLLGCWEETLRDDLSWNFHTERMVHSRSRAGILQEDSLAEVPSWSWLSRHNAISVQSWYWPAPDYYRSQNPNPVTLIDKHIIWEGTPMVSRLLCAELLLRSRMRKTQLTSSPNTKFAGPDAIRINDDSTLAGNAPNKHPNGWASLDRLSEQGEPRPLNGAFDCYLLRSIYRGAGSDIYATEQFLILEPVSARELHERFARGASMPFTGLDYPCFRRIGIGYLQAEGCQPHFSDAEEVVIRLI